MRKSAQKSQNTTLVLFLIATAMLVVAFICLNYVFAVKRQFSSFQCPDEWIVDQMPQIGFPGRMPGANEYFIVNGKRVEITAEYKSWVNKNCRLNPNVVY